jgi:hypothetical protein
MSHEIMRVDAARVPCQTRRRRVYKPRPKRYDGRSKPARRIQQLLADYERRLSIRFTPALYATALKLAELETLAEMQRSAAVRGEAVDLAGLIRLENTARRLRADLCLDKPPELPPPSMAELERRHRQKGATP